MTGNHPTVPTALTGAQIRAQARGEFPASIDQREVMTHVDIAALAEGSLHAIVPPKGVPLEVFPPRVWLPANERIAFGIGIAQHALRDLDDQRAIVRNVVIVGASVLIQLLRAPAPATVRDVRQERRRNDVVNVATFGQGDLQVSLEWPA